MTYKWTVPSTGSYTISLAGSSYDTVLQLYDFTCPVEPVHPDDFICGNDDWPYPDAELYSMPFEAGDPYKRLRHRGGAPRFGGRVCRSSASLVHGVYQIGDV